MCFHVEMKLIIIDKADIIIEPNSLSGGKYLFAQFITALRDIINVLVYYVPQEQNLGKMYKETVQDPRLKVGCLLLKTFSFI